jgi:hypothetical protein
MYDDVLGIMLIHVESSGVGRIGKMREVCLQIGFKFGYEIQAAHA